MRSCVVLLALLPLCFATPSVLGREYYRNRFRSEAEEILMAGRSCLMGCQTDVHGQFNLSATSRPREFQEFCEFAQKLSECFEKCPETPASPLIKQNAEINAQICENDWDPERFQVFRDAQNRMSEQWAWQTMVSCPRPQFDASRMFDKCSLFLNCFFGDALTAVKDGFDDLVVASVVVTLKLEYAPKIGNRTWTEEAVDECSVLFATFVANHTDPSSLSAPACIRYCQNTVPAKFPSMSHGNQAPSKAEYCEYTRALDDCLGKCQESPITPVIQQNMDVNAWICAPDFDEHQLKAFFEGQRDLGEKWWDQAERSCAKVPVQDLEQMLEKCSLFLNCFFGEAVEAVKDAEYDDIVVAAVAGHFQLQYAPMVGRGVWTDDVVNECRTGGKRGVFTPFH